MKKLKTLKDLQFTNYHMDAMIRDGLKQEAIKWIKRLENYEKHINYSTSRKGYELINFLDHEEEFHIPIYLVRWIKHFFNITEEDLK